MRWRFPKKWRQAACWPRMRRKTPRRCKNMRLGCGIMLMRCSRKSETGRSTLPHCAPPILPARRPKAPGHREWRRGLRRSNRRWPDTPPWSMTDRSPTIFWPAAPVWPRGWHSWHPSRRYSGRHRRRGSGHPISRLRVRKIPICRPTCSPGRGFRSVWPRRAALWPTW